ncbi:hypothetical protein RAS1_38260 [Phycisphaerae bacterium RAS1]|nr:hypothetical protein RAS1_38260 [Phycisphaerae bacterium RAS1]
MNANTLTLLFDYDDYAALAGARPDALARGVLAFDPDLHLRLVDEGRPHITPWDVLRPADGQRLPRFEADVLAFWQRHALVDYRGFNLLAMAAYRHISCLSRLAWAAFVIRRALETTRAQCAIVANRAGGHGLDRPAAEPGMPLLFGLFHGMAEAAGLSVVELGGTDVSPVPAASATGKMPVPPEHCHRLGRLNAGVPRDRPFVLLHANGSDLLRQAPLIRALQDNDRCSVIQLYGTADAAALQQLSELGHTLLCERDAVGAPDPPEDLPGLRGARSRFDQACTTANADLGSIYANRRIASHFDFMFGVYARRLAWQVEAWTGFFSSRRPAAIVGNYHAPLLDVAARLGIPTLVLPHGLMLAGETRWFSSLSPGCTIGAISPAHRDKLRSAGVRSERIAVTGDPAGDELVHATRRDTQTEIRRLESPNAAQNERTVRARLGVPADRPAILLITSNLGSPSKVTRLPLTDWAAAARQFGEVAALAARHPEWTFCLRGHPRYDHPRLRSQLLAGGASGIAALDLSRAPLADAVAAADAIVVVNVVTSALMEASLWRRPVLLLCGAMPWYEPGEWLTAGWPHVSSVVMLEEQLTAIVNDPRRRAELTAQTQAAARHFFGGEPRLAAPRCAALLWKWAEVERVSPTAAESNTMLTSGGAAAPAGR